jgi:hypothetical protein
MSAHDRIVWVLGAGFSAGLGGPLLKNLFTETSQRDLTVRYPENLRELDGPTAKRVRWLYGYGSGTELLWSDAEAFIEYLDLAAETPPDDPGPRLHRDRLNGILNREGITGLSLDEMRTTARRLVAAECCGFLEGADVRSERWKPFRRWARELVEPGDTIVTFNYDDLVERLGNAQNEDAVRGVGGASQFHVVLPAAEIDMRALEGKCPILKMHGSAGWTKTLSTPGGEMNGVKEMALAALHVPPRFMAMATPGPSKMREAQGFGVLWDLACKRLERAAAIVFVGFRFPETDAHPREVLLGAIREHWAARGESGPTRTRFHIVLGPPGFDTERLKALLTFVGPRRAHPLEGRLLDRFEVDVHPLYGQDFLAVAQRGDLLP